MDSILYFKKAAEKDNNIIYFQLVPGDLALPDLPSAVQIMKITPLRTDSEKSIIHFVRDTPRKGLLSSMLSSLSFRSNTEASSSSSSSSINPTTVTTINPTTVVDSRPRSDSDIARDLQKRLNAGENV